MKIIYVAKHSSGGNDDEGAIAHALEQMGHTVARVGEGVGARIKRELPADLLLCHKWEDGETLAYLKGRLPRAFWYFDLVDFPDPTLAARCRARMEWMARTIPHVEFGFCTDGDWIERDTSGKLHWLPQGFDERLTDLPNAASRCTTCDGPLGHSEILLTGIGRGGGQGRVSFVEEMQARYGDAFRHVPSGIHGQALADLVRGAKIVLAPDSPVTDRYVSNRLYLMLGLGAFLLHPWSEHVAARYEDGRDLVYYRDRVELNKLICYFLPREEIRHSIAAAGRARTLTDHLYRHRCEELLRVVQGAA